jgi:hypothetical protein
LRASAPFLTRFQRVHREKLIRQRESRTWRVYERLKSRV